MSDRLIKINHLTDYHLNDFLDCPYTFWQKHLLKQEKNVYRWRDLVEYTVNQTVSDIFALPPSSRSVSTILRSIHKHWSKKTELFYSREHYFQVLGSMTSNLIAFLQKERHTDSPLYINQKLSVFIPERELSLAMTLPLAIWDEESFSIKKWVVTNNAEFTRSWVLFTIFFCHHAFHKLPKKIEFFNLLSGTSETIHPHEMDLEISRHYVSFLIDTIQDPNVYTRIPRILN